MTGPITQKVMGYVRKVMAVYEENEDMITIGAYVKGSNPAVDEAIAKREAVEEFLVQAVEEKAPIADTITRLVGDRRHRRAPAGALGLRRREAGGPADRAGGRVARATIARSTPRAGRRRA